MKFSRMAKPLAVLAVGTMALGACATSDRGDDTGNTGAAASGGQLVFGAAGAPKLFDPFYATDGETFRITRQIFDGLLTIKPGTAEVEPALAEALPTSDNGTDWAFKLRSGVKFTDGTPFNAEAVCKNFTRMFEQKGGGQIAAQYWSDVFGGFSDKPETSLYKSCTVKDELNVVVTSRTVTSKFPTALTLASFSMQSPTAMEKGDANNVQQVGDGFTYPAYSQAPVGTGPFKFDKYDEANKTVTLVRNDDYWGEKAKLEKLIFKIVPDESTRRQELKAGSIQGYDLPNPVDWQGLKDDGNQVAVRPPFNIFYVGLNPEKNVKMKDLKVRQALYMAINRDQLVKTQLPEGAKVATQFMPDTVRGYNKSLQPMAYDPTKAKALLKEAGAEGMTIDFAYPSEVSRPYMPNPQKLFEAMRTDLEAVGVKVNVITKPWNGGYLDGVDAGQFDMFLLGWTGDYDSADNFIGTFFTSETNRFHTWAAGYGQQLSADLKAADAIVDADQRATAYEKLNQQIMEEYLPGFAISHSPPALVVAKNVQGLVPSPLTAEEFSTVTVGGK